MKKSLLLGAVCTSLLLIIGSVNAATIIYDEALSGDLPSSPYSPISPPTFNIGIGESTVSGSSSYIIGSNGSGPGGDFDSFFIVLSPDTWLNSVTYHFYNLNILGDTNRLGTVYSLSEGDTSSGGTSLGQSEVSIFNDTSPVSFFTSILSVGTGTYGFTNTSIGTGSPPNSPYTSHGGTWDYTFTLNVSPVPIPAAAWLFGSGLVGLVAMARRKKV